MCLQVVVPGRPDQRHILPAASRVRSFDGRQRKSHVRELKTVQSWLFPRVADAAGRPRARHGKRNGDA
jgi:hypothetical protein